jgi:hypothetical protein
VELGAVVVLPQEIQVSQKAVSGMGMTPQASEVARPAYSPRTPIVGNDALQLWMDRIRTLGIGSLWLAGDQPNGRPLRSRFADLTRQGVEKLLVIKLKSYAEMDLGDLLRFHCERRNPVTDAQDERGPLGVCLLDRSALQRAEDNELRSCDQGRPPAMHYQFRGYTKRLLSSQERQDLARDALSGQCAMKPAGRQVRDGVWIGEGAEVDESVRVMGPAYVGERTTIRTGATLGPFASVEHDCVVDCGTTIERSSVLPNTYLGPGLLIQQSLVDGNCLEHLVWKAVADLGPAGLGRRIRRPTFFKRNSLRSKIVRNHFAESGRAVAWNSSSASNPAASSYWTRVQL